MDMYAWMIWIKMYYDQLPPDSPFSSFFFWEERWELGRLRLPPYHGFVYDKQIKVYKEARRATIKLLHMRLNFSLSSSLCSFLVIRK